MPSVTSVEPSPTAATPTAGALPESAAETARRREESVALAAALLRIDSTNGNETAVAEVLAAYLEANGVRAELVARDPARANLVARIPGTSGARSLSFVGHSDVVPADPRDWTHPPPSPRSPTTTACSGAGAPST